MAPGIALSFPRRIFAGGRFLLDLAGAGGDTGDVRRVAPGKGAGNLPTSPPHSRPDRTASCPRPGATGPQPKRFGSGGFSDLVRIEEAEYQRRPRMTAATALLPGVGLCADRTNTFEGERRCQRWEQRSGRRGGPRPFQQSAGPAPAGAGFPGHAERGHRTYSRRQKRFREVQNERVILLQGEQK